MFSVATDSRENHFKVGVTNGPLKNSGLAKILVDFHGSRSLVFSAVVCVSEPRFFDEAVSKSRFFDQQICLGGLIFWLFVCCF